MVFSYLTTAVCDVSLLLNGILAGLVAVTSGAGYFQPHDALIIGAIGSILMCVTPKLLDRWRIDDPVGAVAVHGSCGLFGTICVGLFAIIEPDNLPHGGLTRGQTGLFKGGGFYLLGIQMLAVLCVSLWSGFTTWFLLASINMVTRIS